MAWRVVDLVFDWYQDTMAERRGLQQSEAVLLLIRRMARFFVVMIGLTIVLDANNVNVNALVTALGVGGLALSLAAQDTLSNLISGVIIIIDQPFRVGDRIEIRGMDTWGDVVDIGLRTTRIRTRDNRMVIVPNASISKDQVINYTYPDPRYRIQMEVGIAYGQDIEEVRQLVIDTVRHVEGVLLEKPIDALYIKMGESAMIFRIRWWIKSYVDTRRMFDHVNTALQHAFDEAGVESPYPTYDIHIHDRMDSGETAHDSGRDDEQVP
jgi:small-conductance mechanosensitive channel